MKIHILLLCGHKNDFFKKLIMLAAFDAKWFYYVINDSHGWHGSFN